MILVCSQTLLTIQTDLKIFKESQRKQNTLLNTMLYLENQFRYAFFSKISSQEIEYFEIHREFLFSANFDPSSEKCNSNRIKKIKDSSFVVFFSPSLEIAQVIGEEGNNMILDRKAECGAMIPIKAKRKLFLGQDQVLYFDSYPLIEGLKQFEVKQYGQELEIKLCFDFCLTHLIPQNEIFYAF